jgi:crotonobetainyl-CoA:carnitine CoA-transferase CaiB-like acyl-CoA transferase
MSEAWRPLAGIRVLDFCWVLAGPLGTRILANFGAEVIHVASAGLGLADIYPEDEKAYEVGAFYNVLHTGKRSLSIDSRSERGRELLLRLVPQCDVVTSNFRPGAMERMGFGYAALRAARSDIIALNMPGLGSRGPWSQYGSYGNMLVAASGINHLSGFAHRAPRGMGVAYADFISPYLLVAAVLAALRERERTGQGQEIDLDQLSGTVSLIGVEWMEYRSHGRAPAPRANRDPNYCPHGVYPAAGEDCWIAIAVEDDAEWQRLCARIGDPALASDPRFSTHAARKQNEDELDARIAAWTAPRDRFRCADELQQDGIAAAAVASVRDALERDPQLTAHYQRVRQPSRPAVEIVVDREAIRRAGEDDPVQRAPLRGADNEYVLGELLGLSRSELDELAAAGLLR